MALAKVSSAAVVGLDASEIEVEVDISQGLPSCTIVGLPDKAVEESKERVRSAIKNSGANFPVKRLTINLAPADLKKEGPSYDLPIAIGVLLSDEQIPKIKERAIFVGELALDGSLRHTNGILPIVLLAREKKFKKIFLPAVNKNEAAIVGGIDIVPVENLKDLIFYFKGEKKLLPYKKKIEITQSQIYENDMAYVKGQESAKRALEIAAAGAHNILMTGPPGSGKTMLARTIPSILPGLSKEEMIEVTKIYSVAGLLPSEQSVVFIRPFRAPHHTTSNVALVGGGTYPRPGEITLSHRGVLFMDEFAEFPRSVLEALRQPLEDGIITVSRAQGSITYPAKFILVAAQNPCPCGYLGDPLKPCTCLPSQIMRYQKKVSGPLLDRIDIHIEVPKVKFEKITDEKVAEESIKIRKRVEEARLMQKKRIGKTNTEMNAKEIKAHCQIDDASKNLLKSAMSRLNLSARQYVRILKVSRTIADLEMSEKIKPDHVAEALQYRPKENQMY